ncbi:uncharacterized protein LOC132700143 [Cylas formicarius]|uniref:uncharacterized protein LOC132700143 n=1 Tax=Cylas formicarius TaxID=197179 RepID=UPI002958C8A7|nr:uncharacterized protein LOC132700143 [Cylas formicarius]
MGTRILLACLLALSAARDVSTAKDCALAKKPQSKLICYYSKMADVSGCYCTHVVLPPDTDADAVRGLKARVKGVKVYVRVGEFNQGLINLLKSTKVDGLDINLKKLNSKSDIVDFISTVKSKIGSDLELMLSVPARPELLAKFFDFKALSKYVSAFIMQTDFMGASENVTFHPSRLSGMWDMQNTDSLVDLVSGLGAPLPKLVITAPVQAYHFTLQSAEYTAPGSPALELKSITRNDLCSLMGESRNWTLERDEDHTGPYIFSENKWVAFEDEKSIDIKAKYLRIRGLAGMALKDVSQDDDAGNCGSSILEIAHGGLSRQSRAPRGAVLHSLEQELLEKPRRVRDSVQLSPYRISRIVDTEGKVHVVRHDSRTEFQCSRQGYFVHPRSCNRFYRCVKFNQLADEFDVFEFDCPAGLAFDERVEVCVWPGSLPHGTPCSGSSEIAPVPKERFACPSEPGYYVDPENCRWFFACLDHGKSPLSAYEFRCPFGLAFDGERLACDWPWLVPKCANGYSTNSEYFYGGSHTPDAILQSYDGLGALGAVKLGGISGKIERPIATVYSNVGGGGGTLGLQYQNNDGYIVGNGLGHNAVQSLQHAGLLRVNNGLALSAAHASHSQDGFYDGGRGSSTPYSSQDGYDSRIGNAGLGTQRLHLDSGNSNGAVFVDGFAHQSGNDLNTGVFDSTAINSGGTGVNSNLGEFGGAQNQYGFKLVNAGHYNVGDGASSSQYHGQASGLNNADSIDVRAHTSQDTLGLQHVSVTPSYVIHQQSTPSIAYKDAYTVQSDGRYSGFADGKYSSNDIRYSGNTNNGVSSQTVVHSAGISNQHPGIDFGTVSGKLNGYTQRGQNEDSIRGNINIVGGGYSAVGPGVQLGAVTSPAGFTTASPISISTIPTVHSVPLPGIKTGLPFETYKGGVVANIPELQYRIHSNGDFGIRNVSANFFNVAVTTPTPFTTSTSAVSQIYSQNTGVVGPVTTVGKSTFKPLIFSTPRPFGQDGVVYSKPSLPFVESTSKSTENFAQEGYIYPKPSLAFGEDVVVSTLKPFVSSTVKTFQLEGYAYPKPSLAYGEGPTSTPATVSYHTPQHNSQYHDVSTAGPSIVAERKPEVFASTTPIPRAQNEGYVYDKPAVHFETAQRAQPVIISRFTIRKGIPLAIYPQVSTPYQEPQLQQPLVEVYKQPQLLSTYTYQPAYKNKAPASTYTYQNVAQSAVGLYPKQQSVDPIVSQGVSVKPYSYAAPKVIVQPETSGFLSTGHNNADYNKVQNKHFSNSGYVQTHPDSAAYVIAGQSSLGYVKGGADGSAYVQSGQTSAGFVKSGQESSGYVQTHPESPGYILTSQTSPGYVQSGQTSSGFLKAGQESSGYIHTHPESPGYITAGQSSPGYVNAGAEGSGYVQSGQTSANLIKAGQGSSSYIQVHPESPGYIITGQSNPGSVQVGQTSSDFVKVRQESSGYVQTHPANPGYVVADQSRPGYVKTGVEGTGYVQSGQMSAGLIKAGQESSGYIQAHPESPGYIIAGQSNPGSVQVGQTSADFVEAGQKESGYLQTHPESPGYVSQSGLTSAGLQATGQDSSGYLQTHPKSAGYVIAGQSSPGYVKAHQESSGYIQAGQASTGSVNTEHESSGYIQRHSDRPGYVISSQSSPGYVRGGQESSSHAHQGQASVDFANNGIENSRFVQIQPESAGYVIAGQSGPDFVTLGQQNLGFSKQEYQNSGDYAHANQKSQVTGYSYPRPQVAFSENPRPDTSCPDCFESKRLQPVSIDAYEFSTPKPHLVGYSYSLPSGSTTPKTIEEGYVYHKPSVVFEEKPALVTPNYNLILSSTPQTHVLVYQQPDHQYIPTAKPVYKEPEGYDYPKPSVQLVDEKPFIKKTAYVTGHQQPIVVENYQHPNYERVKQYILSQQSNIRHEQPQVYVSSTPKPSFISTIKAIATEKLAPVTPASVTIYDSRLTSAPTLVNSRPTIAAPELEVVSSTSRPVSRFSFSSLDDQYQYNQYRSAIESSTALPSVSYTPVTLSREYLPVEVTTPSREYLPARQNVKITPSTVEPEITTLSRDYLPLRTRIKIAATGVPLDQPELIKIVPKTVIKQNDYHPLLSAKLGAQCTCVSNSIRLRKKQKIIVVDDDEVDDWYVVDNSKEPERLVGITPGPKFDHVTRGGYSANDVTPTPSDAEVLKAVKTGLQLVKQAAKEGAREGAKQALDRYGSGGVRSRSETLQGSVDCQRAGLFRHPSECNKFYACRWDCTKNRFTLHVFNCPVHLTFDSNLGACNWPSQGPACVGNTLITSD